MAKKIKRIGVLTGGGDCPGLNAVIRAVVKSALFQYHLEVLGIEDGFLGLIENRMRPLSGDDVSNILTHGGTILGTSNQANPKNFATQKSDGSIEFVDVTETVVKVVQARGLDAVVCIGGDGTMSGADNLIRHGINCIGVPKTIDNDLIGCEMTFGFNTAVTTAAEALDKIHTTAQSHHRVMLVEVMGRNAGWLAATAGAASGADVILIPEIPFDLEKICEYLVQRRRSGKKFSIVCVSEGAKAIGGEVVVLRRIETSPDPIRLGGIGNVLQKQIEEMTELEARATILGHVQRGGTPTPFDRVLATQYGYHALELVMAGEVGKLVVTQNGRITHVDISSVADQQRLMPADDPLIRAARAVGTHFGDG
jgi:ATP-dependent phosphofructokinase / diphosphate-dependent phosphofructokinase